MARKLAKNVYVGETLYMAGSTPPKEDADQITNPAAWGDEAAAAEEPDETDKGYKDMAPAELAAEVEKRNADREDDARIEVVGTGSNGNVKKGDLIAALEADDAANSGE